MKVLFMRNPSHEKPPRRKDFFMTKPPLIPAFFPHFMRISSGKPAYENPPMKTTLRKIAVERAAVGAAVEVGVEAAISEQL